MAHDSAVQVSLANTVPWMSQFISATTTQGSCATDCTIGMISPGASVTVTFTVKPIYNATLTYSASVSAIADPNTTNNSASTNTVINSVTDMIVAMSNSPNPVHLDSNLTYNVTVTNLGPDIAYNVHMNLTQPINSTFVSAANPQGSCTLFNQSVECFVGTMASGASVNISVTVTVQATGIQTGSARVELGSSSSGGSLTLNSDPNRDNNGASTSTTVTGVADLALSATASPNPLHVGQDLTYTFTVTNIQLMGWTSFTSSLPRLK